MVHRLVVLVGFAFVVISGVHGLGQDEALDIQVTVGSSRVDRVYYPRASSIAVKFDGFLLPEGDQVIVRSLASGAYYTYTGTGNDATGAFTATPIAGSEAIVEYVARGEASNTSALAVTAYRIVGFTHGTSGNQIESICGADSSVPSKCYLPTTALGATLPLAYERAQAVVRPRKGGVSWCTGWLVGSEGHMITNYHCISSDDEARGFSVEFGAESSSCAEQCDYSDGCPGVVAATTTTFVAGDKAIDYALVKLPATSHVKRYGYLQLRASGAVENEQIYAIGHPSGKAKRIAARVDDGSPAVVTSVNPNGTSCMTFETGFTIVKYMADTEPGSSGTPVLAARDNAVVALHNCGGCTTSGAGSNQGIDVRHIIQDLRVKGIVVKDLIANGATTPRPSPTPSPTPSAGQCDSLSVASCHQAFFCSWDALAGECKRWWR